MNRETITLTNREWQRAAAIRLAVEGEITVAEAAATLGLSTRQVKRLKRRYEAHGAAGMAHGSRGRPSRRRIPPEVVEIVLKLATGKYAGFNDVHLTEKLNEEEGLHISASSVRRILRAHGLGAKRRRRPPRHRSRRTRRPQMGMLVQVDGSPHHWLEDRGPALCLIGAIDDATSQVLHAHFQAHEDTWGYLKLFRGIVEQFGIPLAVYSDRHSIFSRNDDHWTREEQLRGRQDPTQVARALDQLGVELILAHSPQAKGRIERAWGTFQDRLQSELRLAQATSLEEAQAVLDRFLPDYNRRFAKPPAQAGCAFRLPGPGLDLDRVFCIRHQRVVGNDNTVRFNGRVLQIPPGPRRISYAKARVDVELLMDGRVRIFYQDECIAHFDALPPREASPSTPAAVAV